jgi:hypothetical protein
VSKSPIPPMVALLTVLLACATAQEPPAAPADTFDMQVVPIRHDGVPDAWSHSLPDVGPKFAIVDSVCPGEAFTLLVALRGLGDEGHGDGHVSMTLRETLPSGQPGMHEDAIPAWSGKLPRPDVLVLSQANVGLTYDDTDPLGARVLTLAATDAASGKRVERRLELALVKWSYGDAPATEQDYEAWSDDYHRAPKPAQAVRAFLEFGELTKGKDWVYGSVGLFRTIFTDEPWLLDHLIETARTMDVGRQAKTAILLALVGHVDRVPDLYPDAEQAGKVAAALKDVALPDPYGELTIPGQLDLLWGEFFASGRYRPVRQVVKAFEVMTGGDPVALFKLSEQKEEDRLLMVKRMAAQSAVWSFNSNVEHHELVHQYAQWMLKNDELSDREKLFVSGALKVAADSAGAEQAPR